MRHLTRKIFVGNVPIGGDAPITVQSMTNTVTADVKATVEQIHRLEHAGCDLVRIAVSNSQDLEALPKIKKQISIPLIVDIQFNYKLAIESIKAGADCLRINPGNIGGKEKVKQIVEVANEYDIPLRIGVNSGSLSEEMIKKHHGVCADALVESAMDQINFMESLGFNNLKIALKSSDVPMTIESYKKFSALSDYPLHLGITEAGPGTTGIIKSSVGIGSLLSQGIGDTIRVSLTGDPCNEVIVGKAILKSLNLKTEGINLIACPTCSRTKIDLIHLASEAEKRLKNIKGNYTVAIMGCPVNGPGEAKEADFGISGEAGQGIIFKKGEVIQRVPEKELLDALITIMQQESDSEKNENNSV